MEKQIYEAPAGATIKRVTTDNNRVVIEFEAKESRKSEKIYRPAIGEVVKSSGSVGIIFIHSGCDSGCFTGFGGLYLNPSAGQVTMGTTRMCDKVIPTTHADRCTFFEALDKAGYKWNSKKMLLTKKEWQPRDGDFVVFDEDCVSIFHKFTGKCSYADYSFSLLSDGWIDEGITDRVFSTDKRRMATDAEKEFLLSALHKEGKDWDAEKKEVVELKWRPKKGDIYFVPTPTVADFSYTVKWEDDGDDKRWLSMGLVHRTKEEAISRAKQMLNMPK